MGFHFNLPLFTNGYIGVDIFLVISGFLITGKIVDSGYQIKNFYLKRITRLVPALTFNLAFFSTLYYFINKKIFTDINALEGIYASLQLTNLRLFTQANDYFKSEVLNPYQHLWSLGLEEQFYILWPLLLLLLLKFTEKNKIKIILALTIISLTAYLMLSSPAFYYFPITRFWELLVGGLLYFTSTKIKDRCRLNSRIVPFSLMLIVMVTIAPVSIKVAQVIAVLMALSYLLLVSTSPSLPGQNKLTLNFSKILSKIGDMSYSLYLVHYLVLILVLKVLEINVLPLGLSLITITLTFLFSYLSYKIEVYCNKPVYFTKIVALLLASTLAFFLVFMPLLFTPKFTITTTPSNEKELSQIIKNSINYSPTELVVNNRPSLNQLAQERSYFPTTFNCPNGVYACNIPEDKATAKKQKRILIYGDSHAQMWWPALFKSATENKFNAYLIFKGGCPPAPIFKGNIKNGDLGTLQSMEICNIAYGKNIKLIPTLKPDLLLITGSHKTATWIENFQTTLTNLQPYQSKMVYIKNIPYPREDIIDCYYQNPIKTNNCPTKYLHDEDSFVNERLREDTVISKNKIKYISVDNLTCGETICPGVVDHVYVYLDRFHISTSYAEYVSQLFMDKVWYISKWTIPKVANSDETIDDLIKK
jgi:peptidoglycan/LPS O-acetylase OafA/YrhL